MSSIFVFPYSLRESSNFLLGFIPVNGGGQIYRTLTAIYLTPTLHLARFKASSFSKPTLLLSFSTCVFHVFFGRPRFLLPFTSKSNAFLKTCLSSLLNHARKYENNCVVRKQFLTMQEKYAAGRRMKDKLA